MDELEFTIKEPINLLYLEDSPVDAELIFHTLEQEGLSINRHLATNRESFTNLLDASRPDLILSDFHIPSFSGYEALEIAKQKYPSVPFIVVSGAVNAKDQIKLLRYKADDLILKDNLTRLPFAVMHALANARNRKELQDVLLELRASNKEKEVLLAEIHHRVKNNLAVIASFLELQRMYASNTEYENLMNNVLLRIKSIALVHEKLYQSENLSVVNVPDFISDLLQYIKGIAAASSRGIAIRQSGEALELNINQAVPCGLIISELVSNAIKHAFPDGKHGEIVVEFGKTGDRVWFRVRDNGVGTVKNLNMSKGASQGFTIISALIQQLNAHATWKRENGICMEFTFINDWYKKGSSSSLTPGL
jgi:two-component sensor histidine kinase